jgi:hypothetical protein
MQWRRSSKSHLPIEPRPLVIREQDAYQTRGQRKRTSNQIGHRRMPLDSYLQEDSNRTAFSSHRCVKAVRWVNRALVARCRTLCGKSRGG